LSSFTGCSIAFLTIQDVPEKARRQRTDSRIRCSWAKFSSLVSMKLCLKIWPVKDRIIAIHNVENFISSYKHIRRERRVNLQ